MVSGTVPTTREGPRGEASEDTVPTVSLRSSRQRGFSRLYWLGNGVDGNHFLVSVSDACTRVLRPLACACVIHVLAVSSALDGQKTSGCPSPVSVPFVVPVLTLEGWGTSTSLRSGTRGAGPVTRSPGRHASTLDCDGNPRRYHPISPSSTRFLLVLHLGRRLSPGRYGRTDRSR